MGLCQGGSNIVFATFYASGKDVSVKESKRPDMKFASALRKSHPACSLALMTDQETKFDIFRDIEIARSNINRQKMGRNSWANYFQFTAQIAFMKQRMAQGRDNLNICFIDTDILVMDDISEVFEPEYDYGMTLSDAEDQPINIGMQFVRAGCYTQAIAYLEDVLGVYDHSRTFTAGQEAIAEYNDIRFNRKLQAELKKACAAPNPCCLARTPDDKHTVAFFDCLRYNFCTGCESCCVDYRRGSKVPRTVADYAAAGTKVYHFVGPRKNAMEFITLAYMKGGLDGARYAMTLLPHTEEHFAAFKLDLDRPWSGDLDAVQMDYVQKPNTEVSLSRNYMPHNEDTPAATIKPDAATTTTAASQTVLGGSKAAKLLNGLASNGAAHDANGSAANGTANDLPNGAVNGHAKLAQGSMGLATNGLAEEE